MHPKLHVRFGGRAGETHQLKSRKGTPVRPLHLYPDLVGFRVYGVHGSTPTRGSSSAGEYRTRCKPT